MKLYTRANDMYSVYQSRARMGNEPAWILVFADAADPMDILQVGSAGQEEKPISCQYVLMTSPEWSRIGRVVGGKYDAHS